MLKLKLILKSLVLVAVLLAAFAAVVEFPRMQQSWLRNKVASKIFEIRGTKDGGGGTGWQVDAPSDTQYIVTNSHVCEFAERDGKDNNFLLVQKDGHSMRRRILEVSDKSDLCLIEGWPGMSGLSLSSQSPAVGDMVIAVGHPLLGPTTMTMGEVVQYEAVTIMHHIMKTGIPLLDQMIHARNDACNQPKNEIVKHRIFLFGVVPLDLRVCMVNETDAMATNTTIFPGSSGSPVVDKWGQVLGVMFASDERTHWGDAVNLEHLRDFLKDF